MDPQIVETRSPGRPPAVGATADLRRQLTAVERRLRLLLMGEGLLRVLAIVVGLGWVLVLADLRWELSVAVRRVTGLVVLAVGAAAVAKYLWRPWRRLPREDQVALLLERQRPVLRSRVISALQLGRVATQSPESEAFTRQLVADAGLAAAAWQPAELFPATGVRRAAAWAVPILVGSLIGFWVALPTSALLIRRALLEDVPLPRRTRIVEVTGARTLGRGDDLRLEARVEGVIPKVGRLLVRQESGRLQELPIEPEAPGAARFVRVVSGVPSSFRYRVRVNDAESDEYFVEVLPRPLLTNLVLTQVLPPYTGIRERRVEPGALTLLRGSRLRVEGRAGQSIQRARVQVAGGERTVELTVDSGDRQRVTGEVPIDDLRMTGFSVDLVDERGIQSRDPAVYAVEVVEDQVPQVRILVPARREELVTPHGTVLVAFEARDDFGLGALRLRHQPAAATNGVPAVVELDLTGETNTVVRRRFEWRLPTLQPALTEGGFEEFWVEAMDRDDVTGPHTGRSERYLLRVVTEAEKRADLLGRAGDAIGRLGDVAQGQERLNESLGRIIVARPSAP